MIVIDLEISKIPLKDFMKALGCEPVRRDGHLLAYDAPYAGSQPHTMVVDTRSNTWFDSDNRKVGGGIYDLAREVTGSCSRSELNWYIAGQMHGYRDFSIRKVADTRGKPELPGEQAATGQQKPEPPKPPKRRMRF